MLKLHGFAVSNYYNMVKLALMEKGIDFEEVKAYPSQQDDHLNKHPTGKVPALETDQGFIGETSVILDYIELGYPQAKSLIPSDPYQNARVKELMQIVSLYIEMSARLCYPEAYFGGKVSDETKEKCLTELEKGIKALKIRSNCSPYLAGDTLTLADVMFIFSIDLAMGVGKIIFQKDILADFPEAKELIQILNENPNVQKVLADKKEGVAEFMAMKKAAKK